MIFHGFKLHLIIRQCWASFHVHVAYSYAFGNVSSDLLSARTWLFWYQILWANYIFWLVTLLLSYHLKYFFPTLLSYRNLFTSLQLIFMRINCIRLLMFWESEGSSILFLFCHLDQLHNERHEIQIGIFLYSRKCMWFYKSV